MDDLETHRQALAQGALIRPQPQLSTLIVTGEDASNWLSGLLTAKIEDVGVGQGCYALAVSKVGRICAEVWVARTSETFFLGVDRDRIEPLQEHLERYLVMEDVELEINGHDHAWWFAHGPKSPDIAEVAKAKGSQAVTARYGHIDTALIIAARGKTPTLTDDLLSTDGAMLCTPSGWNHVHIDHLLPLFGVDFQLEQYPQEGSLEKLAVSFNKGCYLGQEAVFMLEKRGNPSKRLVRLELDAEASVQTGQSIHDDGGKEIGTITSVSTDTRGCLALGIVRFRHSTEGTVLRVGEHDATVTTPARLRTDS